MMEHEIYKSAKLKVKIKHKVKNTKCNQFEW